MLSEIDQLKKRLDAMRPLPVHTVRTLHEQQVLEWTYHSNAIEGNTLTLKETRIVLEGITVGGKPLREHFEVINHKEAIDYVENIVQTHQPLSEWKIKSIHHLVLKNIGDDNAGIYRQENVLIVGAQHRPPHFIELSAKMAALIFRYQQQNALHPVERAARLHADFVGIHPFVDGNGRTSRLLMNFELLRCGYLPVIVPVESRLTYYDSLDVAHTTGDYTLFVNFIAMLEKQALTRYLNVIENI